MTQSSMTREEIERWQGIYTRKASRFRYWPKEGSPLALRLVAETWREFNYEWTNFIQETEKERVTTDE